MRASLCTLALYYLLMSYILVVHADEAARSVTERIAHENLDTKLDAYLASFADKEVHVDLKITTHDPSYSGVLNVKVAHEVWHYERERYERLDDLINHLFDKLKENLSKK